MDSEGILNGLSFFNLLSNIQHLTWDQWLALPEVQAFLNLSFALILGGCIGLERTIRGRQAGVRTYALVSLASGSLIACFISLTPSASHFDGASRVIQGILTGLGFLGAGVIMRDGLRVKGLTTAASIWLTAAIGIVCGLGQLSLAFLITFSAWVVLVPLRKIEDALPRRHRYAQIQIELPPQSQIDELAVKLLLSEQGMQVIEIGFGRDATGRVQFDIHCVYLENQSPNQLAKKLIQMGSDIETFHISSNPDH